MRCLRLLALLFGSSSAFVARPGALQAAGQARPSAVPQYERRYAPASGGTRRPPTRSTRDVTQVDRNKRPTRHTRPGAHAKTRRSVVTNSLFGLGAPSSRHPRAGRLRARPDKLADEGPCGKGREALKDDAQGCRRGRRRARPPRPRGSLESAKTSGTSRPYGCRSRSCRPRCRRRPATRTAPTSPGKTAEYYELA